MNKVAACVLLSSCLALTGCSGAPEQLAFSSDTCAELQGLDVNEAIEHLGPYDDDDLSPIVEYIAAADAVGAAAKAQFDSVNNALSLEPSEELEQDSATDMRADAQDQLLQASLAPNLVAVSTLWASELERVCGNTVLTNTLWHVQADAWFMQAEPPSGYCDALISGDFEAIKSAAPEPHSDWFQTLESPNQSETDLGTALVIEGRTTAYYETHCP